jgi:hypothetical protein
MLYKVKRFMEWLLEFSAATLPIMWVNMAAYGLEIFSPGQFG